MFYCKNEINDYLCCKQCGQRLIEPKILPCGVALCRDCAASIKIENKKFVCPMCPNRTHEITNEGLPTSETLIHLLKIQPIQITRGKSVELLQSLLNEIQKNINVISHGINNSIDHIKEHCIQLRNQAQLATEQAIQKINNFNQEIMNEINAYESECIRKFETKPDLKLEFDETLRDLQSFHAEWTEYLRTFHLDEQLILNANEAASSLLDKCEHEKQKLNEIIFDNNILTFDRNEHKLSNFFIGTLIPLGLKYMRSSILSNNEMIKLITLCDFVMKQKWNLVYRASRDGFEAANFHSKCNDKAHNLVVIKSTQDNVFGGYTDQDWSGNRIFKNDPNSFIFSLINKQNKPTVIKCNEYEHAIFCDSFYGPIFGRGHG